MRITYFVKYLYYFQPHSFFSRCHNNAGTSAYIGFDVKNSGTQ